MRLASFSISFLLATAIVYTARAVEVSFSTPRTAPELAAVLGLGQPLFIEVAYTSDSEIWFQAKAFRDGKFIEAGQILNTPFPQSIGKQSTLVWVRFRKAATVDEIRVTAFDAMKKPIAVRSMKANLLWMGGRAYPDFEYAGWVNRLQKQRDASAATRQRRIEDEGTLGKLRGWVSGYIGG